MSGQTTANSDMLIRAEIWSQELKDTLKDTLDATRWVDWLSQFPDGTTFTMPSIGDASVQNIEEDKAVKYEAIDTGEWQFSITEYIGSAHYMTRKLLHDSFYAQRVMSEFVPRERRAIMERLESDILRTPGPSSSQGGGQTANATNAINGYAHRFVGSGSASTAAAADFAKAKLSLKKANVPMSNLVAFVDPTLAYWLETATNIVNVSNNPAWEGIITTGMTSGMRFIRNIYGIDIYESNYLANVGAETIGGVSTDSTGVQNLIFSADASVLPIVGAWRQMPEVDAEFNKDFQREEYVTTAYYGLKLFRPENMVCLLTNATAP